MATLVGAFIVFETLFVMCMREVCGPSGPEMPAFDFDPVFVAVLGAVAGEGISIRPNSHPVCGIEVTDPEHDEVLLARAEKTVIGAAREVDAIIGVGHDDLFTLAADVECRLACDNKKEMVLFQVGVRGVLASLCIDLHASGKVVVSREDVVVASGAEDWGLFEREPPCDGIGRGARCFAFHVIHGIDLLVISDLHDLLCP